MWLVMNKVERIELFYKNKYVYFASGVILIALFVYAIWFFTLPIKTVVVESSFNQVKPEKLLTEMKKDIQGNLLTFDSSKLRQQVELKFPWVAQIQLKRKWFSHELLVRVKERQVIAVWNQNSLVDNAGNLFLAKKKNLPASIVYLNGPTDAFAEVLAFMQQLQPLLRLVQENLVTLSLQASTGYKLILEDGTKIYIGKVDPFMRLQRFLRVSSNMLHTTGKHAALIDLRYPHGFAVKWIKR